MLKLKDSRFVVNQEPVTSDRVTSITLRRRVGNEIDPRAYLTLFGEVQDAVSILEETLSQLRGFLREQKGSG